MVAVFAKHTCGREYCVPNKTAVATLYRQSWYTRESKVGILYTGGSCLKWDWNLIYATSASSSCPLPLPYLPSRRKQVFARSRCSYSSLSLSECTICFLLYPQLPWAEVYILPHQNENTATERDRRGKTEVVPDRPFHNFRAARSGNQQNEWNSKTSCDISWSSKVAKGSVR